MVQQAVITKIEGETLTAELTCSEACGACAAKQLCGAQQKKEITLQNDGALRQVGQTIAVEVTRGAGLRAVALVYLAPVAIMVGVLVAGQQLGWAPWASGVGALGTAALYFLAVKLTGVGEDIEITIID